MHDRYIENFMTQTSKSKSSELTVCWVVKVSVFTMSLLCVEEGTKKIYTRTI